MKPAGAASRAAARRAILPAALALLAWAGTVAAHAQGGGGGARASLHVPPGQYTVGDPIDLTITVDHPGGAAFDPPDLTPWTAPSGQEDGEAGAAPSLSVDTAQLVKSDPPDTRRTVWRVRVRPFATGEIPLPPITLRYQLSGAPDRHETATEAAFLRVASVLAAPDEPPADIRGPWRLPRSWWWLLAGIAAALAAAAVAYRLYKRRKPRAAPAPEPAPVPAPLPEISPYERAMRELEALLASRLLAEGRLKEFHVRISEIVKAFLGGHLRFDAVDRTTGEVLDELARVNAGETMRASVRWFLDACDLVKFAKHRPAASDIDETVRLARALIDLGRPAPEGEGREVAA